MNFESLEQRMNFVEGLVEFVPNWPKVFRPVARRCWEVVRARLWEVPHATDTAVP